MEGDAGTRRLNPTDADETPDESLAVSTEHQTEQATEANRRSRLTGDRRATVGGRRASASAGWSGICAGLLVLAAGAGGRRIPGAAVPSTTSEAIARAERGGAAGGEGLRGRDAGAGHGGHDRRASPRSSSARPVTSGVQAPLYSSVLAEAYQAGNVKVQVSDMRAAVERHNADGSVDVLVAVRVKVTNSETADQDRVPAACADGSLTPASYKIARLDQVSRRDGCARRDARDAPADESAPEQPIASWLARAGAFSRRRRCWASR